MQRKGKGAESLKQYAPFSHHHHQLRRYSKWTAPLCYIVQLLGFYDTGMMFMFSWYWKFPDENAIEEVLRPRNTEDRKKMMQRRIQCALIQLTQWYVLIKVATVLAGGWSAGLETVLALRFSASEIEE